LPEFLHTVLSKSPAWNGDNNTQQALATFLKSVSFINFDYANTYTLGQQIASTVFFIIFLTLHLYLVRRKNIGGIRAQLPVLSFVAVVFLLTLFLYQEPMALELYLYILPFFWLILMIAFYSLRNLLCNSHVLRKILNVSVIVLLSSLFLGNFIYGIFPAHKTNNADFYREYLFLRQQCKENEPVIVLTDRRQYFFHLAIWQLSISDRYSHCEVFPVNYQYSGSKPFYEGLKSKILTRDTLLIFTIPENISGDYESMVLSNIIRGPNGTDDSSIGILMVNDFLNDLTKFYRFKFIEGKKGVGATLLRLTRRMEL
jgi:hypothetical protein